MYSPNEQHSDCFTSASNSLTKATAVALSAALFHPLDSILTRLQVRYAAQQYRKGERAHPQNGVDVLVDFLNLAIEGFEASDARKVLYSGMREAVCKQTVESMLVPKVYAALHARLNVVGRVGVGNELLLSLVSMALVKLTTEPLGAIMVRRQVKGSSLRDALDDVLRQKGVGGLWSAYGATLVLCVRSCVLPVMYMALRKRLGIKRGGWVSMLVLRVVAEAAVYRVAVMQCCVRAGVKAARKGSLGLEVFRALSSHGVTTMASDFVAMVMMHLSAVMLYMLEPFLLSEQAITDSVRENVDDGASQLLLDDAKYMNRAVKRAIDIVNRGIGLASHGRDDVAVAQLVGDYVEDKPGEG
ncbi:hypothetical protein MGYG_02437 [Nannizzia gypsea CBS 118893]|uniref:Mitochondrial carrier protein n=1 Tax=Arthroderma gypseum (strain ATCC MYA-4604 / CBS 118893) TaxID=535722 RepID=E4UMK9_ARTGP|nr:hypothetical protein MGYG_02437 [Nannizzia gypsea CBS 118893]EFQ99426.1 hypothetical protein MGYG_02437 [Nannizzia gypsea CBS 118893]